MTSYLDRMGTWLRDRRALYIYLFILLVGSVIPVNSVSTVLGDNYTLHIRWDYLLHALVYMPLPVLMALNYKRGALISFGFAALFELLQMIIPYRAFNINDLVANGVGVVLGLVVLVIFRKGILERLG